jgi:histidinol-phosphate phosphatase family protein
MNLPEVFILAGGLGTRLSHVVDNVPKPMAPINNRPFLEYIIRHLKSNGFTRFCLLLGYKSDVVIDHFGDGNSYGVSIRYSVEPTRLGTGGAIKFACDKYNIDEKILILNGDSFFGINYSFFVNDSSHRNTIALHFSNDLARYGSVQINDDYSLSKFVEKSSSSSTDGYINAGAYYLDSSLIRTYKQDVFSIEYDVFSQSNVTLYGIPYAGYFIDIGTEDSYAQANHEFDLHFLVEKRPCLFLDRDGTLIQYKPYIRAHDDIILNDSIVDLIQYFADNNYLIGIVSNQAGVAKNIFDVSEPFVIQQKIVSLLSSHNLKVDFFEYCFTHPNGTIPQYSYHSLYRKPSPGMLLNAAYQYNIDLHASIMIGDNITDVIKLPYLKTYLLSSPLSIESTLTYPSVNDLFDALKYEL